MALSAMELQLGIFVFCWPHTRKQMQTKCVHDLCVLLGVSRVSIFMLRPQYIRTWQITFILIVGKTQINSIWAPCQNKDGAGCGVSCLYLYCKQYYASVIQVLVHLPSSSPDNSFMVCSHFYRFASADICRCYFFVWLPTLCEQMFTMCKVVVKD